MSDEHSTFQVSNNSDPESTFAWPVVLGLSILGTTIAIPIVWVLMPPGFFGPADFLEPWLTVSIFVVCAVESAIEIRRIVRWVNSRDQARPADPP